jgi:hypothetical protein
MAKRLINWDLKESTLEMGKYIDAETKAQLLESFDIKKIFPSFAEFNEVQSFLIVYGLKQKLADCGSAEKSIKEKVKLAKEKFQDFVDGKITGVRANATGAKENKALASKIKDQAKVVSLEGLIMKRAMFPETFTEEDQEKLNEFLDMQTKHSVKQKSKASKASKASKTKK